MPKLWLTLFFGYNGTNFHGMQFQLEEHVTTVEDLLVDKLYPAGFLPTNHHSQLERQERWSRAARTDKGVHAVLNAVSALFTIDQSYFHEDHTLNRNKLDLDLRQLFEGTEIVFHGFKRVTTRFQVRHSVKSRHYCYVCPKSLFRNLQSKTQSGEEKVSRKDISPEVELKQAAHQEKAKLTGQIEQKGKVEVGCKEESDQELIEKIQACCRQFVGSHNFHNYSKNLRAKDPQAQRYIIRFEVESLNEDNFIFNIVGQSFIYHQIRKMIGCIIMTFINHYPPTYIPNTFFRNQIHMPLAPAAGLYLNSLSFDPYNQKQNIPEPLTFENVASIPALKQQINEFILKQGSGQWSEWVSKLKESIYHGIEYICEEEKGSNPAKVEED